MFFLYNFIASIHTHRLLIFIVCTCVLRFFIASVHVIQPMCEMDLSGFDEIGRYIHVNHFNDQVYWHDYHFSDMQFARELYHEQTVSKLIPKNQIRPKPTEHDSAYLQFTKKQVANLRRYSAFYNGHFSRHPIDDKTDKIWIAIDNVDHTNFNLDLCIDLIWTNCQDKPALPDFQRTDLGEFLDI